MSIRPKTNTIPHLGVGGVNDVQNIKRWIGKLHHTHTHAHKSLIILIIIYTEEAHLDPNDPRNFELLQLAEVINTHHTLEITGTLAL